MAEEKEAWTVAAAKAHFGEVIDRAVADGPQFITRCGRTAAVVVSVEDWERAAVRRGTLAEFFATSPLPGSGLVIERPGDGPREIEL